jgi:hypothetical protein
MCNAQSVDIEILPLGAGVLFKNRGCLEVGRVREKLGALVCVFGGNVVADGSRL